MLLDLVIIVLAAKAMLVAWLHPGGIFEFPRTWLVTWGSDESMPEWTLPRYKRAWHSIRLRIGQLVGCRVCLPYHAALWMTALYMGGGYMGGYWRILQVPVIVLAVAAAVSFIMGREDGSES